MPSSFTVFGVTFHAYGLILGFAMLASIRVAEYFFITSAARKKYFWNSLVWILLGALVGARLWHVATDWHLYQNNPLDILSVWNGGLSILGAIAGVGIGTLIAVKKSKGNFRFLELSDSLAIGLPFGQAIGRLGNWINQELYGLPTGVPWKIYIDPAHRFLQYKNIEYYHPLFAYELLLMIGVSGLLWLSAKKLTVFRIGQGMISVLYLATYSWIRFFLEFLRIDKSVFENSLLGINQVIMLMVAIIATLYLLKKSYQRSNK